MLLGIYRYFRERLYWWRWRRRVQHQRERIVIQGPFR